MGLELCCSTIDAAWKLKKLAALAIKKCQFGAAVSLDMQNAFSSMLWAHIIEALVNAKVSIYLHSIIQNDFQDPVVLAQTASGMIRNKMTCGIWQGSVFLPLQWNITFDDILKKEVPPWGAKYHPLCRRYPGGYSRGQYPHA